MSVIKSWLSYSNSDNVDKIFCFNEDLRFFIKMTNHRYCNKRFFQFGNS